MEFFEVILYNVNRAQAREKDTGFLQKDERFNVNQRIFYELSGGRGGV